MLISMGVGLFLLAQQPAQQQPAQAQQGAKVPLGSIPTVEQIKSLPVHGVMLIDRNEKEQFIPEGKLVYASTKVPVKAITIDYIGETVSGVPISRIKYIFPHLNKVYVIGNDNITYVVAKDNGWYDINVYADIEKEVVVAGFKMIKRIKIDEPVLNYPVVVLPDMRPEVFYKEETKFDPVMGANLTYRVINEEAAHQSIRQRTEEVRGVFEYSMMFPMIDANITFDVNLNGTDDWAIYQRTLGRVGADSDFVMTKVNQKPGVAWKIKIGKPGSNIAASKNAVFVPTQGTFQNKISFIWAIDKQTGKLLWKFYGTGNPFNGVVYRNGKVYAVSDDGYLYVLRADNGALIWKFKTGAPIVAAPAVVSGRVFLTSRDHYVYALDDANGTLVWKFRTGLDVRTSPLVVNGIVYVGSDDNYVYALSAKNGFPLWRFQVGSSIQSSISWAYYPSTGELIYFGSNDDYVYALKAGKNGGTPYWKFRTLDPVTASPIVVGNLLYVASGDKTLYALDAKLGLMVWRFKGVFPQWYTPNYASGSVFVVASDRLYCVDASTSELRWQTSFSGRVVAPPIISAGTIFVGTEDGYLYALR